MEEDDKKKEFQSRREFFKNAAKGILPILGVLLVPGFTMKTKANAPQGCN